MKHVQKVVVPCLLVMTSLLFGWQAGPARADDKSRSTAGCHGLWN